MSITLYTAPDCRRCKIVKGFLAEHQIAYETVDFKADAQTFNTFYRANRKAIYRNPEGVEFPLFDDGTVIKQGSGEVIAYLLSGHALEGAVTRSDLLHGWISGLYLSQCPAAEEDHFVELVQQLAKGGLTVCIQTDGRNPALLERLIGLNALAKVQLNIRVLATPLSGPEGARWPNRDEAGEAARMVFEACGDHQLPYAIAAVTPEMPQGMQGLEPVADPMMLKYRSASREFLFKADIAK